MSLTAALLVLAQSAAPMVADAPARSAVAQQATATARVLRPARISFAEEVHPSSDATDRAVAAQRQRDSAGTVWIEFS